MKQEGGVSRSPEKNAPPISLRDDHVERFLMAMPAHGTRTARRALHDAAMPSAYSEAVGKAITAGLVAHQESGRSHLRLQLTDKGRATQDRLRGRPPAGEC